MSTAFTSLAVRVEGEVPAPLAARVLADWQRQRVTWPAPHTLRLLPGEDVPDPPGQPFTASTPNGPLSFHAEHGVYRTAGLGLETSGDRSRLWLGPEVSPAALLLAFTEVQRAAGLLPLHAAVLHRAGEAGRAGETVAISGPSGAGKSTAALRLLGRGWHLVAEDWAWLNPASLELVGWDSGLRLRPESLTRFAPHLLGQAPTDAHGKRVLSPPRLLGEQRLNRVYFLGTAASTAAERVRAVWGMVGVPLTPAARQATQAGVDTLLREVPVALIGRDALVERLGL